MTLETVSTKKRDLIKKFSSICPTESKKRSSLTNSKSTKVRNLRKYIGIKTTRFFKAKIWNGLQGEL
jgi:hypothetical protein